MLVRRTLLLSLGATLLSSCAKAPEPHAKITVAAAANLSGAMAAIAAAFQAKSGIEVVLSYGSTAQLSQQIENGAPFDVFAAADTEHVDRLVTNGKIAPDTRAVYARGQLALWAPKGDIQSLNDLTNKDVRFVAIAQPDLAPYGKAAVEAIKAAGLWEKLQPKLVYATNINLARQFAATGNADAAFTAYSLVMKDAGVIQVDPKLHSPIDQAVGIVTSSNQQENARQFAAFLRSDGAKAILKRSGYQIP
jgi:molybdate transport system substrate-binding protein